MDRSDERRAQAERTLERDSLRRLSAAVTDPALRAPAREFAAGRLSAAEFVRRMANSPAAMRGFDRFLARVVELSPAELDAIGAARQRDIDRIANAVARTDDAEEDAWYESRSWLE